MICHTYYHVSYMYHTYPIHSTTILNTAHNNARYRSCTKFLSKLNPSAISLSTTWIKLPTSSPQSQNSNNRARQLPPRIPVKHTSSSNVYHVFHEQQAWRWLRSIHVNRSRYVSALVSTVRFVHEKTCLPRMIRVNSLVAVTRACL